MVAAKRVERVEHRAPQRRIERRRRLVGDHHLGTMEHRHRKQDTLPHPPGEFVGIPRGELRRGGQPELREELQRAPCRLRGRAAMHRPGLDHLRADAHRGVQGEDGLLEDHRDPPTTHRAPVGRREVVQGGLT